MFSSIDDYPVHQIAEPVRHVATSDRNFYDRYYFNCFPRSAELMLAFGLGQYPNLDVTDAFAVCTADGTHRVVRSSRELGDDRGDLGVGPLRLEVLQGMRRLRLLCDPAEDYGLRFDLTWEAESSPVAEPRQWSRQAGRVLVDSMRLGQVGRWTGQLNVAGRDYPVDPEQWLGFRDRSWGIRPVGEPEPRGERAGPGFASFYWLYTPMQFEKFAIFVALQEDSAGRRRREHAVRVTGSADPVPLGTVSQQLRFRPGSRELAGATLEFADAEARVQVTPLLPLHVAVETGYGLAGGWRHGAYRGSLWVDGLALPAAEARQRSGALGVVEVLSRYDYSGPDDTATGYGMFEYLIIGPHQPSGFTEG
jgi:hypothetical protein